MNKLIPFLLSFSILTGCISPLKKQQKAEKRVEAAKTEIAKTDNEIVEKGRNYIWAADYTLSLDSDPNKYASLAKDFTSRAVLTLGEPKIVEALDYKEIINNLLSTNAALVLKGNNDLKEKDSQIIDLQAHNTELAQKLSLAEAKQKQVSEENAVLANKWSRLIHFFWIGAYVVIGAFIFGILAQVLPQPYNSIAAIVGLPLGLIVKFITGLLPAAKSFAGVVSTNVHTETKTALTHIIESIEQLKSQDKEAYEILKPILKQETSKEVSRPVISEIKKELGYL